MGKVTWSETSFRASTFSCGTGSSTNMGRMSLISWQTSMASAGVIFPWKSKASSTSGPTHSRMRKAHSTNSSMTAGGSWPRHLPPGPVLKAV